MAPNGAMARNECYIRDQGTEKPHYASLYGFFFGKGRVANVALVGPNRHLMAPNGATARNECHFREQGTE